MQKSRVVWAGCIVTFLLPAAPVIAADTSSPAADLDVDADAMTALERMGAALRTHKVFTVKADVTNEDVLEDGQKLQYSGVVDVQAVRPDRFKMSLTSDIKNREFYYDGKSVTVVSPKLDMYAAFPAPSTIRETVEKARSEYGIELPLADLFSWGMDKNLTARVSSAFLVRPEHVNGQLCDHYAFRQKMVDWQIWIAEDASALPCKLVITNTTDPSMPQYTAIMHWSFPESIADGAFTFSPPSGARKIVIAKAVDDNMGKATP